MQKAPRKVMTSLSAEAKKRVPQGCAAIIEIRCLRFKDEMYEAKRVITVSVATAKTKIFVSNLYVPELS